MFLFIFLRWTDFMEQKKEIIKRKKIISNAISLYNKEYDELISKFENKVCK